MFFHRDRKDKKIGLAIAGLFLLLLGIFFWWRNHQETVVSRSQGEEIFKEVLFDPIPEEVSAIQALQLRSDNTDTYLKFQASRKVFEQIMGLHAYKKIECSDKSVLQPLFAPVDAPKNYSGSRNWDVLDLKIPECYATLIFNETGIDGKVYSNKLHQNAQSEFIFDSERNIIYFHERGI